MQFINLQFDCFAFGEIVLETDYKKDAYNLERAYSWSNFKRCHTVLYKADIDCVVI